MNKKNYKGPGLNPGEGAVIKAQVYDLFGNSAKQVLYGIIQVLQKTNNLSADDFKSILDDGIRFDQVKNGRR